MDEQRQVDVKGQYRWCFASCGDTTWQKQELTDGPWICTKCKKISKPPKRLIK